MVKAIVQDKQPLTPMQLQSAAEESTSSLHDGEIRLPEASEYRYGEVLPVTVGAPADEEMVAAAPVTSRQQAEAAVREAMSHVDLTPAVAVSEPLEIDQNQANSSLAPKTRWATFFSACNCWPKKLEETAKANTAPESSEAENPRLSVGGHRIAR